MTWHEQLKDDIRFEWGLQGATQLGANCDVIIVVDVLSFTTCVEICVAKGATVYPFTFKDERARYYALSKDAILASAIRSKEELSLSPAVLDRLVKAGNQIVLPSPNGSTISFAMSEKTVLAGSLRNAKAVAAAAEKLGKRILVVASGEQWPDGSLRPAIEDLLGAGAIITSLSGKKSVEALSAEAAFLSVEENLEFVVDACSSGTELREKGFPEDNKLASALNSSEIVPILKDSAFVRWTPQVI